MHIHLILLYICFIVIFVTRLKTEQLLAVKMVVLPQDSAWIVINKNEIYSNTTTKSFSSDSIFSRLFSLGLFSGIVYYIFF